MVTAADRAVERQVVAAIRAARPGDAILGEEFGDAAPGASPTGVRWVLDPIDGTVNYLYGLPHYAVSLAAEVDGVMVAGVVRNAATGEEWTATLGGGAYRDGRRLTGSVQDRLGQALVATGFGYDPGRRQHQGKVIAGLIGSVARHARPSCDAGTTQCSTREMVAWMTWSFGLPYVAKRPPKMLSARPMRTLASSDTTAAIIR